ncbi:hypothetical protein DB88DRAFT_473435 [Papiliotrema laurentii]|uniref:Uncharacterized protein n=1 Tax=Papiliotrema laurentii TaxID=5418 RepID=A0AAD9CZW7_PAPLA|nr:hypothetical protein DB88DRAFT_473435 [Papiliotrema laurentii]
MSLGFIIPALLAGIGVAAVALLIHRKKNDRARTIPQPVTSPRGIAQSALPTLNAREARPPVQRVASHDSTLPTYLAANVIPPPPVYDPASPLGPSSLQRSNHPEPAPTTALTNSTTPVEPQPVSFPVLHPPAVTPYVPYPPATSRAPSYRSESRNSNSSSTTIRPGMIVGGVQTLGAPPRYEVVMAR